MPSWDGDALAGSMEETIERQQEAAEARRARKEKSSPEERERKAREESMRLGGSSDVGLTACPNTAAPVADRQRAAVTIL